MAQKTIYESIAGALKAIDKVLAGERAPIDWGEDLAFVERYLGLNRPLASYAPRTRRRYIAAARKGQRATQARQRETTMRQTKVKAGWNITPAQLTKLNKVRIPIMESGIDINEYLDQDVLKEVITTYGFKYTLKVLTQQYDSIKSYTVGNTEPGRARWNSRGELEEAAKKELGQSFNVAIYFIKGTDPYYYYHGIIR